MQYGGTCTPLSFVKIVLTNISAQVALPAAGVLALIYMAYTLKGSCPEAEDLFKKNQYR